MAEFRAADLTALTRWDTPTICNGLAQVAPERRAAGFTRDHLHCFDPSLPPVVGFARTVTIRATLPPPGDAAAAQAVMAAYYAYIASAPGPTVTVVQDLDPTPGFGAFWGEVSTAVHSGLGSLGAITNGSIRDLDACAPGFQMLAGKVGPSPAHVHVVEFGGEVEVCGMRVRDGDIVHADRHGAVVVPRTVARLLPAAIERLARREAVVLDCARAEDFDLEKLLGAMTRAAGTH